MGGFSTFDKWPVPRPSRYSAWRSSYEIHGGSGRLVFRGECGQLVLDGHTDHFCLLTLDRAAVTRLFDAVRGVVEVSRASWVRCPSDGTAHLSHFP